MITSALINGLLSIVGGFFSILPDISWNVESGNFQTFLDIVGSIAYLLPLGTINSILSLTVGFFIFRAIVSLIRTIWELLPIV